MERVKASLDKDPADVARMFDQVAARYDTTNDVLSLGRTRSWRRAVADAVGARPGLRVLDLAAGTGASSEPFADAGADVTACDFSEGMLAEGRRRRPDIRFVQGDATRLPFDDETFDVVTISFGLRNVQHPDVALREMLRVARPGGRLVVCEFSTPTWRPFRHVYTQYITRLLPAVAKRVSSDPEAYVYLWESIREWPDQIALARIVRAAGWDDVRYRNLSGGIVALHRAHKPGAAGRAS